MDISLSFASTHFDSHSSLPGDFTIIGFSELKREIRAWRLGNRRQRPTLIVAGQHGDETCAMTAAESLVRSYQKLSSGDQPAVWIIPCLNPDARAVARRLNAQGVDLNRDHLARLSPEVRSLHEFIRQVQPGCVLDLHCFPSRRRWMKEFNVEHAADLLIDWATGPAEILTKDAYPISLSSLIKWFDDQTSDPFRVSRYWLRSGRGRVRHSTPDWLDLRNQVAACHRIPTYLIEGREPLIHETEQVNRTIDAMVLAVTKILRAYHERAKRPSGARVQRSQSSPTHMPTRFQYQSRDPIRTHLRDRISHRTYTNPIGTKLSDHTLPSHGVRVARELWIPKSLSNLIGHLQRLGAPLHEGAEQFPSVPNETLEVVQFRINGRQPTLKALRNDRKIHITQTKLLLSEPNRFVVLIPPLNSRVFWNALLDPRHKFSIYRMHRHELSSQSDNCYPILFQYQHRKFNLGTR